MNKRRRKQRLEEEVDDMAKFYDTAFAEGCAPEVESALIFTSPESSNMEGGTYDTRDGATVLAFRDKKDPAADTVFYYYENVTRGDWDALAKAESKGKHMIEFRKRYRGVRLQ